MQIEKKIPQFVPYWDYEEINAVNDVLKGDWINEGSYARKFEKDFAQLVGAKYCVITTSGTIALYMAMMATKTINVNKIIVPSIEGIFCSHAVEMSGSIPIPFDVNEKGILPEMDSCKDNYLMVHANGRIGKSDLVEDCAQATTHHTKRKISCYSFASSKHITMGGQGGAVCCDDELTFNRLWEIKDHGRMDRLKQKTGSDNFNSWGSNFKVTEMQASFGYIQLQKLGKRMNRLHEIYRIYTDELNVDGITILEPEPRWYIDVDVKNPKVLKEKMNMAGIELRLVQKPLHLHENFLSMKLNHYISDYIYNHHVYLPSSTCLSDDDVLHVCKMLKSNLGE